MFGCSKPKPKIKEETIKKTIYEYDKKEKEAIQSIIKKACSKELGKKYIINYDEITYENKIPKESSFSAQKERELLELEDSIIVLAVNCSYNGIEFNDFENAIKKYNISWKEGKKTKTIKITKVVIEMIPEEEKNAGKSHNPPELDLITIIPLEAEITIKS